MLVESKPRIMSEEAFPPRPHISLEWNPAQQKVQAKQAQIALSWRSLNNSATSGSSNCLADVVELPEEIFDLSDLRQILSIETWNSCLTTFEREHLYSFLPAGANPEEVVALLLSGECFNFGNPLVSWGNSLSSGALHPDRVASHEAQLRNERRRHLLALHSYHRTMIQNLQELKNVWIACETPEKRSFEMERWAKTRKPACLLPPEPVRDKLGEATDEDYLSQRLKKRRMSELPIEEQNFLQKRSTETLSSEVNTIQVSRKQFAEIATRKQSGEEVRLDTLQEVLAGSKTWQKLLNNESFGYEVFKSSWRTLARKDIPDVFKSFSQRVSERRKMTTAFARECMLRSERSFSSQEDYRLEEEEAEDHGNVQNLVMEQGPSVTKLDMNVDSLLYYPKTRTTDEDELASIQELWSYNYLQDDAPIHL